MTGEIEIYYRYSEFDKRHQYCVVCKQGEIYFHNYWIFWVWFKLGRGISEADSKRFELFPFKINDKCKLIKSYKTCNSGTDRVVKAIRKHFYFKLKVLK